ncbi:tRNA 2-thiouridine(34) synthase MnmA [Patescibacteria group bacterium]|nr:tRNA 2-thiouridine(34) synthase MnmA [Patescibacteria group bacterium]MBU4115906.1 tRNA 2-thiouridine(34) synthase MnmA [Patescibacteria group bacterium]
MNLKKSRKIFVAMSGGVDSSVSAFLLKEKEYDITGVFIKVWHPEFAECDWKKERDDAMRICAQLNIPFLTFDFEKEYKKEVVDYMIKEYKNGRTPNPDVMCNKNIKFGVFLKKAQEMGADMIATGHYARLKTTQINADKKPQINADDMMYKLYAGIDKEKDQSYFLWALNQEQLSKTLFPIGDLEKSEVRKIAKENNLVTAEKKDSQGVCFIGKIQMKEFLKNFVSEKKGDVLNERGEVIGHHEGAFFYTIGQRHGFTITKKKPDEKPYYIISKNISDNALTVREGDEKESSLYNSNKVEIEKINWISGEKPSENKKYLGRIRYRQPLQNCFVKYNDKKTFVIFEEKQKAVALGQSVVLYDREGCLGGGVIEKIL